MKLHDKIAFEHGLLNVAAYVLTAYNASCHRRDLAQVGHPARRDAVSMADFVQQLSNGCFERRRYASGFKRLAVRFWRAVELSFYGLGNLDTLLSSNLHLCAGFVSVLWCLNDWHLYKCGWSVVEIHAALDIHGISHAALFGFAVCVGCKVVGIWSLGICVDSAMIALKFEWLSSILK